MDNVDGVAGLLVWNIHFLHNMISSHLGLVALIHLKSKNLQTFYQSATFHEKKRSNAVCTNHLIVLKKYYWRKQNFKTSAQKKNIANSTSGPKVTVWYNQNVFYNSAHQFDNKNKTSLPPFYFRQHNISEKCVVDLCKIPFSSCCSLLKS